MRRRGWVRRACLAAGVAAAAAASCQAGDQDPTEGNCYTEYGEPGDVHATGTQTMPDGTEWQIDASASEYTARFGADYTIHWNDERIVHELTFSTTAEDGEPFDLRYGELCTRWMPGDGTQLPPCATVDGEQGCHPECAPAVGFGRLHVVTECDGDTRSYEQLCHEYVDGEVTLVADVTGHFGGTVQFSIVTRLEQTWCSSGDFSDIAAGCSKR